MMGEEENERKLLVPAARNISMEISVAEASAMFPGFRFSPTDEELIHYYLKKKLRGSDQGVEVIPEVDICRHEPWDLPAQAVIQSDNEWFFFSPRGRKYPNGSQSKRATESGYWKATGKERSVKSGSNLIGTKRTLVFHTGRAPKGQRTEWIMHEYCTSEKSEDAVVVCRLRKNREFHLNDNTPRRNSRSERDISPVNNGATPLSGGEQSGLVEGAKAEDGCCSKEGSSSYNSHSVEQVDTGSESDDKITNGSSHSSQKKGCDKITNGSSHSSHKKGCDEEEDWYADIMKDDIIKLDDSSLHENPEPLRVVALKLKPEMKSKPPAGAAAVSVLPFQGTANRRLRLRKQRLQAYQKKQFETFKFTTQDVPIEDAPEQRPESLINNLSITRIRSPSIFLFLVMLILLILILFFMGDFSG